MVTPRTHTQVVAISGVATSGGKIAVTSPAAAGVAVSSVLVTGQPIAISAAGGSIGVSVKAGQVSIAAVGISGNKLHVDLPGVNTSGGKIKTTAAGGGTDVAITNISGDVRVTAGNAPLPVLASISGDVKISAGAAPIPVTVAGQPIAVSVQNQPRVGLSGVNITSSGLNVHVQNQPHVGLSGVNITGSALDTRIANISGDVRVTSGNSPLTVSAAGGRGGAVRGDAIFNVAVSNPVKYASIDVNAAACANVVGAVASRRIRVLGYNLISAGTVQATWCTTGTFTRLTGGMQLARGVAMPATPYGYFQTAVGSALSLRLNAGVSVAGHLTYQEVF